MSTPEAYYKWVKLGDIVQGPVTFSAPGEGTTFESTIFGDSAVAKERGRNATRKVSFQTALQRTYTDANETARAFDGRRYQFADDLASAAEDTNTYNYNARGDLVYVWDSDTDSALITADTAGGAASTIVLASDIGVEVGSWLYTTDGAGLWEVAEVDGWVLGTLTATLDLTNAWLAGQRFYLANWVLPNCWRTSGISVSGGSAANLNYAGDIELEFEGLDAFVR